MTGSATDAPGNFGGCDCKVGRVIVRRELDGLNDRLVSSWTAGEASLRELEREFNLALLGAAMRRAGMSTLDGEVANLYRLLSADEVTSGTRTQARSRLGREGVDVNRVESEFVSHQTIHTHLRECVGVRREDDVGDPVETAERRIRSLQTRLEVVATDAIEGLRAGGEVSGGAPDVYVDVAVVCGECGSRRELGTYLDDAGCDCE